MPPAGVYRDAAILLSIPSLIVALGCGARLLPEAALTAAVSVLLAWACLSVPLAVLIGHCVLGEE